MWRYTAKRFIRGFWCNAKQKVRPEITPAAPSTPLFDKHPQPYRGLTMHSSFAKRCAILEGLRERARLATAEFYQKPGVSPPSLAPLFIVKPVGGNNFQVLDRATGKIVAQRFGHNNATGHARALEAETKHFSVKQFGRAMSVWALRIGAILTVFAFLGSQV